MITATLIDNVWATKHADKLSGYKLMLAEVFGGKEAGKRLVVIDVISAGIGDRVIISTGSSARRMLGDDNILAIAAADGIIFIIHIAQVKRIG